MADGEKRSYPRDPFTDEEKAGIREVLEEKTYLLELAKSYGHRRWLRELLVMYLKWAVYLVPPISAGYAAWQTWWTKK